MFKSRYRRYLSVLVFFGVIIFFQNCGNDTFLASQAQLNNSESAVDLDLGDDHPGVLKPVFKSEVEPLYANRVLLYNMYKDIFGPSIKSALIERIAWSSQEMGASFGLYSKIVLSASDCPKKRSPFYRCNNQSLDLTTPPVVGVSAPREGRRIRSCQIAIDSERAFDFVLNRIEPGKSALNLPESNEKNYHRAFQLFFRGKPLPSQSFFDNFSIIMGQATTAKEGWKSIILSLCLSPHWQVL